MTYSVVVADDHPVYLDALSRAVDQSAELALAGTANDGAEAVELIVNVRPDVAVLDVEMPIHSGPSVAARLAQLELPTRVLFLSAHRDGATVYDALAAGGYGYVTKDASMREIQEAVLRVAAGVRSLGADVEHQVIGEIQVRAERQTLDLTERERSVLELAVQGLTVIAMGRELHLSPATVKVHLSTLYAKLGVSDRASAVAEAIRRGLVA
ncbi:response regulator transcription factor [Conexibacter woesei]|uniref:response regulator transcription factor n=1 Tax=Conexibacter woesei TaxID=191495 RepID=UPI00042561F6|nr:response regulator transcription factor [Conexibacter woesei]